MGILNKLFNKKQKQKNDLEIKDTDSLGDIAVKFSKDGIVSAPKDDNHNTFGESLDKLVNGELPWGWEYAKRDFIKPRDRKLNDLSIQASKVENIDDEIKLLREFVLFFEEYQNECKSKGECYEKYFYNMYIHDGSTNRNHDYYWLNQKKERLKCLEENRDIFFEVKRNKDKTLKDLPQKLEDIIIKNPGILQSDIYKQFDESVKDEISSQLYFWSKSGKIKREKSGRTYKIYYNS